MTSGRAQGSRKIHLKTTRGTPKANGGVEKFIDVIMTKARTSLTLTFPNLSQAKQWRQQSTSTTGCLTTRGRYHASSLVQDMFRTSAGVWLRLLTRVDYRKPSKTEQRGEAGVMVGYDNDRRAYMVFLLARKMIVTSRDVVFDAL